MSMILTLSPAVRLHSWQVELRWQHWLGYGVWLVGFAIVFRMFRRWMPDADPYLLPIGALLSGWGLLTIWRLDAALGLRQTIWLAIALVAFTVIIRLPNILTVLRRYKYLWLTGSLLLTAWTLFFGTYPGGGEPRLWLELGGVYFQPSEPLKLMLIVFLAAYLTDRLPVQLGWLHLLLPSLILTGAALMVLVAQRDLGTATLIIVLYAAMIFQATGKRRVLVISAISVLAAGVIGYQLFEVIRIRIAGWLNPWLDPSGHSYQIIQSLLAIAVGGIGGSGFGLGNPNVVPVVASDFIFAAIGEESGLIGEIILISLFTLLAGRGILTAFRASHLYQRLLSAGVAVFLVFQGILIMGGNLRVFPLTGVTLPFVSYGGSSLLTSFICLALLVLVSGQSEEEPAPLPNPQAFLITGSSLLAGLMLIALSCGYWAIIRADDLSQRVDNPRWTISERYVKRGALLDRNNQVIVQTTGQAGAYQRTSNHPALGNTTGYTHVIYGKAGLESTLDPYLRGVVGNPSSSIVASDLLYAQTPPGLDVRLSIDLRLQTKADSLLQGKKGALVILNAQTGEILALASHPFFDPNQLDEKWPDWIKDSQAIFLNRATQGQYPLGGAIGPFLLAEALASSYMPPPVFDSVATFNQRKWLCAFSIPSTPNWGDAIENGCPGARLAISQSFTADQLIRLYQRMGFTEKPNLLLPTALPGTLSASTSPDLLALGQSDFMVSPLQVALAAAMISTNNPRPIPQIASAVHTPHQGWVVLNSMPLIKSNTQFASASATARLMQNATLPVWQSVSTALSADKEISWYLGGTIPEWQATPLVLALVLEDGTPSQAREIGSAMLQTMTLP